jgi:myosin heavy subunit
MNLANILTRRDPLKRAFVTLEDDMADALDEEFLLPVEASANPEDSAETQAGEDNLSRPEEEQVEEEQAARWQPEQPGPGEAQRISPHTQNRLASHAAFDEARSRAQDDLNRIAEALAGIVASHHMGREFLQDSYADILRANDLENASIAQAAENRRLAERVDKLERLRARYDQLVEVLKRREARLLDEADAMREAQSALRLELVEARSAIARSESLYGELQTTHAARSSEAERYLREAEMLREKNAGLSVELELVQKRQAESRRRAEELSSMHASDSARLAEIMARLVTEEAESTRLQKLNDALEAKLIEANEHAGRLAADLAERDTRHQSETQALRGEIQALNVRLQNAAGEQRGAASELAEMRAKMAEFETERTVLEKKLAAFAAEMEQNREDRPSADQADVPSDQQQLRKQAEQMRRQIAELQGTVEHLKQYEALHMATKARSKGRAEVASGFSVAGGKIVPEFAAVKQAGRA